MAQASSKKQSLRPRLPPPPSHCWVGLHAAPPIDVLKKKQLSCRFEILVLRLATVACCCSESHKAHRSQVMPPVTAHWHPRFIVSITILALVAYRLYLGLQQATDSQIPTHICDRADVSKGGRVQDPGALKPPGVPSPRAMELVQQNGSGQLPKRGTVPGIQ